MSRIGSRSENSISIASTAAWAISSDSAATAAIGWPFQRTSSHGQQRLVGRDAEALEVPVDVVGHVLVGDDRVHAGHRRAPWLVSIETMRALWCGERSALHHRVPCTRTSSTYCVRPVTWAMPS